MPVKIRLQRRGRTKSPFYHIVVADSRSPRDGRFIEKIGTYNPMTVPATIDLDSEKAFEWLMNGAQPTDTARAILRFKGVMYRKHLQRGVNKGALTEEQAEQMWKDWITEKEAKVAARMAKSQQERQDKLKQISGTVKKKAAPAEDAPAEAEAPAAQDSPAESEAPAETAEAEAPAEAAETPAEEPTAEAPAEETPSEKEAPAEASAEEESSSEEETPAEEAKESAEESTEEASEEETKE